MSEIKFVNPFENLPKERLKIIRKDFEKGDYRSSSLKKHLRSLYEDDLAPEEVLDIIESKNSDDWKTVGLDEFSKKLNCQ